MAPLNRNILEKFSELLSLFPVVILLGVRQCGKTTLVKTIRPDWQYFDLESGTDFDRITEDFDFFFKQYPQAIIIDEAQRSPELFKELRGVVDKDRNVTNRFLLTGSSSPELLRHVSESLAGRVGIIELGTFKTNETHSQKLPEFYQIFEGKLTHQSINFLSELKPELTSQQTLDAFLKGGYPEPVLKKRDRFYKLWMENYLQTYVQRDIRSLFPRLDLVKYRRFTSMLSSLNGTVINRSQLGRSLDTSDVTIRDYLEIAAGTYLWRNIPSYEKNPGKSVIKMAKGSFRDSGLANYIQGIKNLDDLIISPNVGSGFESFVIEEIMKGIQATQAIGWRSYYYRTRNGAEVDLIVEGDFGLLPIEIKFGSSTKLRQLKSLRNFVHDRNLPLGILINNANRVEMLAERIIQIPVTCL